MHKVEGACVEINQRNYPAVGRSDVVSKLDLYVFIVIQAARVRLISYHYH